MLDVEGLMAALSVSRPVFHSEADFQHALAWQFHLRYPTARIRLEKIFGRLHIDIAASIEDQEYAFELKYKTRKATLEIADESFYLQNHSAHPPSRYDFVKDIARLESIAHTVGRPINAFAVFLSNDEIYWRSPGTTRGISADFSIHEGRRISGELGWGPNASAGTRKGREEPIKLRGEYQLKWRSYSLGDKRNNFGFCYTMVAVTPPRG